MRTFIIDQFTYQQAHKRFLWNTITGLGWAFWIYLWLPLLRAIAMLLGPHPEHATSDASRSIQELFATLTTHVSMTVLMIAAFLVWTSLQWWGTCKRRHTVRKQSFRQRHPVLLVKPDEQKVNAWRQAQRMVVIHDEDSGLIQHIDILKNTSDR
jgi:poly-beta-1,6-N-acetyl-D-glucosamine biosynthesis protein PgaD